MAKITRRGSLLCALFALGAAIAALVLWWYFARIQSSRPTKSDAVFVRNIEAFLTEGSKNT